MEKTNMPLAQEGARQALRGCACLILLVLVFIIGIVNTLIVGLVFYALLTPLSYALARYMLGR